MKTATVVALLLATLSACTADHSSPRGTIPPADVAAPPDDAMRTPTGLAYRVLAMGSHGPHPGPDAHVVINFTGWTTDGTIVEGAPVGSPPATIHLSEAMPGWQEGIHMMAVGDKWRFWIPAALAYGDQPGRPQGMLVYDITLVRFIE